MRILVLGGDGLLGHQVLKTMRGHHEVLVTLRREFSEYSELGLFDPSSTYDRVDVRSHGRLREVFAAARPHVVVNCIGLVKQRRDGVDAVANIELNALLPHRLADLCRPIGARLIHISTDCVFSGKRGDYSESDTPDATDIYGRSKLLGEVDEPACLTLRTSFVGHGLVRHLGLVDWLLAQQGSVLGYRQAVFSGPTSNELAAIITRMVDDYPAASGLFHVSADPIDKCSLLELVKERYSLQVEIIPDDKVEIDRSLDSSRFRKEFNYTPPPWSQLVASL